MWYARIRFVYLQLYFKDILEAFTLKNVDFLRWKPTTFLFPLRSTCCDSISIESTQCLGIWLGWSDISIFYVEIHFTEIITARTANEPQPSDFLEKERKIKHRIDANANQRTKEWMDEKRIFWKSHEIPSTNEIVRHSTFMEFRVWLTRQMSKWK